MHMNTDCVISQFILIVIFKLQNLCQLNAYHVTIEPTRYRHQTGADKENSCIIKGSLSKVYHYYTIYCALHRF